MRPWQLIAADLFEYAGKRYLISVDYYSDYFEVDQLTSTSTTSIVNRFRAQFSRHGIPEILFTDNGPQFTSEEFQNFRQKWGFEHRTSSPYYSQSNGKAESAVKIAKHIMTIAKDSGEDPYLMLLEQRNMPTAIVGYSPVQRIFGRRTRTALPTIQSALNPEAIDQKLLSKQLQERRDVQKSYYDRGARQLPELREGDKVWVQCVPEKPKIWGSGVVKKCCGNNSYEVLVDGVIKRRNRRQIKKAHEPEVDGATSAGRTRSGKAFRKEKDVGLLSQLETRTGATKWTNNTRVINNRSSANDNYSSGHGTGVKVTESVVLVEHLFKQDCLSKQAKLTNDMPQQPNHSQANQK